MDNCIRHLSRPTERHIALKEVSRTISEMIGEHFPNPELKVSPGALTDYYGAARVTDAQPKTDETTKKRPSKETRAVTPPLSTPLEGSINLDDGVCFAISRGAEEPQAPEPKKPLIPDKVSPTNREIGATRGSVRISKRKLKPAKKARYDGQKDHCQATQASIDTLPAEPLIAKPEQANSLEDSKSSISASHEQNSTFIESSVIINECPFLSPNSPSFELYGAEAVKKRTTHKRTGEDSVPLIRLYPHLSQPDPIAFSPQPQPFKHQLSLRIMCPNEFTAATPRKHPDHYQELSKFSTEDTDEGDFRLAKTQHLAPPSFQASPLVSSRTTMKSPRTIFKQVRVSNLPLSVTESSGLSHRSQLGLHDHGHDDVETITEELQRTLKSRKGLRKVRPVSPRLVLPVLGLNKDRDIAEAYGVAKPRPPTVNKKRSLHTALKRLPVF